MANAQNIVVINDEAHHAWRHDPKSTLKGVDKEGTRKIYKVDWRTGPHPSYPRHPQLFRFNRHAIRAYWKTQREDTLFKWIISDSV